MATSRTRTQLETELARRMGDAANDGTPNYARWSLLEYRDAINSSIELFRHRYMERTSVLLTLTPELYDYPISGVDYIVEIKAESNSSVFNQRPAVGSGIYEYIIPLDLITFTRDPASSSAVLLHIDKAEMRRQYLSQAGLKTRVIGYKYPSLLAASADTCVIPFPTLLDASKAYLHMNAAGRDNNDLMKHLRQWQSVMQTLKAYDDQEVIEESGGKWVE